MEIRFHSMDLLRSFAIITVVLAHSVLSYGAPSHLAPLQLGGSGVDLFFVLSGWLLGGQLFKEAVGFNSIDFRRFWVRRWMRTFPAYYVILVMSVLQQYLTKSGFEFPWRYFVFLQNYDYPLNFFSISWSLCVEEQFYLLIAPLIGLTYFKSKNLTTFLLAILLVVPFVCRMQGWFSHIEETHVRVDCCVAGVMLANIYRNYPAAWRQLVRFAVPGAVIGLGFYLSFYVARYFPGVWIPNPEKMLLLLIFSSWVLLANANDKLRNLLYVPGAYYVATRSYALYLVHPEVLALLRRVGDALPFALYFCVALAGSLLLSELLYRLVEKPIMDMRENYDFSKARKKSS